MVVSNVLHLHAQDAVDVNFMLVLNYEHDVVPDVHPSSSLPQTPVDVLKSEVGTDLLHLVALGTEQNQFAVSQLFLLESFQQFVPESDL